MAITLSFDLSTPQSTRQILEKNLPNDLYFPIHIHVDAQGLTIKDLSEEAPLNNLRFSLLDKSHQYLSQTLNKKQILWRALHIGKSKTTPTVVDCTSGFGTDSFILHQLGAHVISIECNPLIAVLLKTAVHQFLSASHIQPSNSWTVVSNEADKWIKKQDVTTFTHVYLDPFFHKKSPAKPKNPMQWLQKITQEQQPHPEKTLHEALKRPLHSVIVKRARHADYLDQLKPNRGSLLQKTSRFDCYYPDHANE